MSALSVSGPVARLDEATVDGRLLRADGYTAPAKPLPLLALHAGFPSATLGHAGAEPVGVVSAWDVSDGVLEVAGDVYDDQLIPPGKYPCGLEARFEPEGAERRPDERWPEGGLLVVRAWTPLAVVLYLPGSTAEPAWPDLEPLQVTA